MTCLDDDLDDVQNLVTENVLSLLAHVPNSDLSHRLLGVPPELFRVQLDVEPAERSRSWKESVTLELPAIKWQQSSDVAIVYLPSLGIEILANKAEDLPRFIEDQIRLALFRTKTTRSLKSLILQARCRALKLHSVNIDHFVTGLPLWLLDDQIPLDLARAEAWISARVIGQPDAVLTARVREQPFAVILLDEFEKAHHSLFDLLAPLAQKFNR